MEYEEFKEKVEFYLSEINRDKPNYKIDEADEYLVRGVYETYSSVLDCDRGFKMAIDDIGSIFSY